MSRRRREQRGKGKRDDPRTWDLSLAVMEGNEEGLVALVEAVRRYGAADLELGYDWPDDGTEPTAEDTVTWYARATFHGEVVQRQAVAEPGHHQRAQLEALAELVRSRGGNVQLVDP